MIEEKYKIIMRFTAFKRIPIGIILLSIFLFTSCYSYSNKEKSAEPLPIIIEINDLNLEEPEDPLLNILWKYDIDSYYLVYLEEQIPYKINIAGFEIDTTERYTQNEDGEWVSLEVTDSKFHGWITSEDHFEQLNDMITAVHETSHTFTAYYAFLELANHNMDPYDFLDYKMFFLEKQKAIIIKPVKIPPVSIIIDTVPELLKVGSYSTYIVGDLASSNGIYGLLNEFNAYYHDARFSVRLYNYFKNDLLQDFDTWHKYRDSMGWATTTYYEFRYYILTYMIVLREIDPTSFNILIENEALSHAFTEIDNRFLQTVNDIDNILQIKLPAIFEGFGFTNEIKEGRLRPYYEWIDLSTPLPEITGLYHETTYKKAKGEGSITYLWDLREANAVLLKEEMNKPEYQKMAALLRLK